MTDGFPFLPPNAVQITVTIEHTDDEGTRCVSTQVMVQTHKLDELHAVARMAWKVNKEAFAEANPE